MYHKTVLSISPSSFGSRYERFHPRLTPPNISGISYEEQSSRRSSVEFLSGNNAVSFPSSYGSRPPVHKETGSRSAPPPTIGFTQPPLEETEGKPSPNEQRNNFPAGMMTSAKPGLLSLTLHEELLPPPRNRNLNERVLRLADQFDAESEQPWSLTKLQKTDAIFTSPVVVEAYEVASWAHAGQLRKSGEPVLAHCVETAKILADINADAHIVAAALLHDVVDDTCVSFAELQSCVSADVYDLVKKVSKLSYMSQLVRDGNASIQDYGKLKDVFIASVDCRAVLIKMADRIHNMRTVSALSPTKQSEWAKETMDLFVPLAGRLGCWGIKSELEDLSFAILHPQDYAQLKSIYDAKVACFTEDHLQGVLNELKVALDQEGIEYEDISGRPKNLYGVFRKMQKKGYEDIDTILDLFALRIVIKDGQSCREALKVVHSLWPSVPNKLKDYVERPKPNGYRSIHDVCLVETMPLEVQIRTTKMHYIAEHGVAAHWRYKEATDATVVNEFVEQRTLWSRYVLNWVFELNDKKLRPDDLQDTSGVLQSIWNAFWSFEENDRSTIACQHGAKRGSSAAWCPVHVVVKQVDSLQVCDAPLRATLEDFLLDHCGILKSDGRVPMVNGAFVAPNYALQFGDLIEFSEHVPAVVHNDVDTAFSFEPAPVPQSTILPFGGSHRDPVLPN